MALEPVKPTKYSFILDIHNIEWCKTMPNSLAKIKPDIHLHFIEIITNILKNAPINWDSNIAQTVVNLKIGDYQWKWKYVDIGPLNELGDVPLFHIKKY